MKKHLFSFYTENIAKENKKIIIKKENPLFHRLTQVLRYKINEQCILFDHHSYYCLKIESIEKDKITSLIEQQNLIISEDKKIIAYIPLIEKDYLSKVLYTCGQIGIKDIFFVKTDRSHIKNIEAYDIERLEKIMIAGCEQARQYRIPKIHSQVITIKDIIYDNFYFF